MTGPASRAGSAGSGRSATPPPSDRQLRPKPHRASSSAASTTTVKPAPRPALVSRPSMSAFFVDHTVNRVGYKFAVGGNCQTCMAAMRDAYDKMHAEHVKAEAEASGR